MARSFTVHTTINRPARDVFDAIVNPEILGRYFVDRASGSLEPGRRVVWHWDEWGDFPVEVDEVEPPSRISLRIGAAAWGKTRDDSYDVRVDLEIIPLGDDKAMLKISESGWKDDADGIKASYENCGGWQNMADCAKAWLEHGIDLRADVEPASV